VRRAGPRLCPARTPGLWFRVNADPPLNDRGVLKAEDWAEIRRLHRAEGMAVRVIARRLGISRNTVRKALASHEPPRYVRVGTGSAPDGFEPEIRALLAEFPKMPTCGRRQDDPAGA
jgi:hypothetical protein